MEQSLSRLQWSCRRGMLELDVMLYPFLEHDFQGLTHELQQDFIRLLECSDLELFRCLLRDETPKDASLISILGVIREKHQARHSS